MSDDNTLFFEYDIQFDQDNGFDWCLSVQCTDKFVYDRLTKPIPCD